MQLKLEAIAISKQFANNDAEILPVLEEVSLQVKPCEFVSIVGASGCGKTTFLRILDGLIPPTSGGLLIDGREVTAPDHTRGFVFQNDSLWPWRTAMGNGFLFGNDRRDFQIEDGGQSQRRVATVIMQRIVVALVAMDAPDVVCCHGRVISLLRDILPSNLRNHRR